jgi:hypothetical protein
VDTQAPEHTLAKDTTVRFRIHRYAMVRVVPWAAERCRMHYCACTMSSLQHRMPSDEQPSCILNNHRCQISSSPTATRHGTLGVGLLLTALPTVYCRSLLLSLTCCTLPAEWTRRTRTLSSRGPSWRKTLGRSIFSDQVSRTGSLVPLALPGGGIRGQATTASMLLA